MRFFFQTDSGKIEQLIYKPYLVNGNNIAKNNFFRVQLQNNLRCTDLQAEKLENLNYEKRDLVKFFSTYNDCANSEKTIYPNAQKQSSFSVSIRPGINVASLSVSNTQSASGDLDFGSTVSPRLGLEIGTTLPFHHNQ